MSKLSPTSSNPFYKAVSYASATHVATANPDRSRLSIHNKGEKDCVISNDPAIAWPSGDAAVLFLEAGGTYNLDEIDGSKLDWYAICNSTGSESTILTGLGPV